jgi:hypothetical protein
MISIARTRPSAAARIISTTVRPGVAGGSGPPQIGATAARAGVGHRPIPRQHVRQRADVAGALDVRLAAQRVDAGGRLADLAGQQGQVRQRQHQVRAVAALGDAHGVQDRRVAAPVAVTRLADRPLAQRVEPGGALDLLGRHA